MCVESSWNVMAHGDAWEEKWRSKWRMEWVASTLHYLGTWYIQHYYRYAHTSAASSRLNWRTRQFKWARPFRRKTKSGFCACAITFQTQSNSVTLQVRKETLMSIQLKKYTDFSTLSISKSPLDGSLLRTLFSLCFVISITDPSLVNSLQQ